MGYSFEEVIELFNRFWDNGIHKFGNPTDFDRLLNDGFKCLEIELNRQVRISELELIYKLHKAVEAEEYEEAAIIKKELDGIQGKLYNSCR